jgi:dienelactone hydrolase
MRILRQSDMWRLVAAIFGASVLNLAASAAAQEKIRFPSLDGDLTKAAPTQLEGLLYPPSGSGPFAAIVLMHGCGGLYGRDGNPGARHDDRARRFHGLGYVVLHVDSFTPRGLREICTVSGRTIQSRRERARDAYGALVFLQGQPFVRHERIGIMGWSNGGSTTLWTILDPISARPKNLKDDFAAAIAFYPACRQALDYRAGWRTKIPLLILIGEKDDWTPAAPCVALAEKAQTRGAAVQIHVYPHAYHDFDAPNAKLRVLKNIATTESGSATIGTDPQARHDAIERAPAFFAKYLPP